MTWPNKIVLVRHAQSEGNVLDADQRAKFNLATHNYGLTQLGVQQAESTRKYLHYLQGESPYAFDAFYSSYYQRAKATLQILYPESKHYEDPRLAEAQRGIYHSMTREEIAAKYPEELLRKDKEGLYHYRPWGGENWADVELRIHSFLGTLARDYSKQDVLIVCHGHWLILFQRLIERFSIQEAVQRYKNRVAENASVTIYQPDSDGRLKLSSYVVPWKKVTENG